MFSNIFILRERVRNWHAGSSEVAHTKLRAQAAKLKSAVTFTRGSDANKLM